MIPKLVALCCMVVGASAQACRADAAQEDTGKPIPGGTSYRFPSKILGEERTVFVALPPGYNASKQSYPVLYMTDAQFNFDSLRSSAQVLSRNRMISDLIIVGVTNRDRTRDLYATRADFKFNDRVIPFPTSGNADNFLKFIEEELIPWVEAKYRTVPLRILAGHSAGGYFSFHAMRTRPNLFQAIIGVSPWLPWDDGKELKALIPFFKSDDFKTRALFFSSANEGRFLTDTSDAVRRALKEAKNKLLRWDYETYPKETHDSTSVKAYYDALRMIFDGWAVPTDPNTGAITGTLDDLKKHFVSIGQRLGSPLIPPENVLNQFGYDNIREKRFDQAVEAFRYLTEQYPESSNAWDSLADGFEAAGKKSEAIESCRKAVALGEAQGVPTLETIKKHLARLLGG